MKHIKIKRLQEAPLRSQIIFSEFRSNDFVHFHNALRTVTRVGCSSENGKSVSSSKSIPESRAVPDNEHKMATIPRARTPRPRLTSSADVCAACRRHASVRNAREGTQAILTGRSHD